MKGRPRNIVPILPVKDFNATLSWYESNLGATDRWLWGEPTNHAGCSIGSASIQFSYNPALCDAMAGFELFVTVFGIEDYYQRVTELGAQLALPLQSQPWGASEFVVLDLNGIRLRFNEFDSPPDKSEPLEFEIQQRRLTPAENRSLMIAVGWLKEENSDDGTRHPSLFTVVANYRNQVIGAATVSGNGVDTFRIRDVVVRPEFQGRGVGSKLMLEVLAWVDREVPKGEFVTLETGTATTRFYEKLGFQGADSGFVGMYIRR